jgi:hypothetical protein
MGNVKMQAAALLIFLGIFLLVQVAGSNPGIFEGNPQSIFRVVVGVGVLAIGLRRLRQGWMEKQNVD